MAAGADWREPVPVVSYFCREHERMRPSTSYRHKGSKFPVLQLTFLLALFGNHSLAQQVTDADGNSYPTVIIGNQVWTAANLRTTKFSDGSGIPQITGNAEWNFAAYPGYCWYSNVTVYKDVLGALYNYYAVETGKLCPEGWHVPSDAEWSVLENRLGGAATAGGMLKSVETVNLGTGYWYTPNTGATNASGFSAYGGGARELDGAFYYLFTEGWFWSSTGDGQAVYRRLSYLWPDVERGYITRQQGCSVRCLRDEGPGIGEQSGRGRLEIRQDQADGFVRIVLPQEIKNQRLTIADITGKIVYSALFSGVSADVDVWFLPSGMYIATVTGHGGCFTGKFIRE